MFRHFRRATAQVAAGAILAGVMTLAGSPASAASGQITTVAGASRGEGPALGVEQSPVRIAGRGHLFYMSDHDWNVVRVIDTETGEERVVAGTGDAGFAGDGGPASAATLQFPLGLAISPAGDLHIADAANHRVRKIDVAGRITTVVGTGTTTATGGSLGDGGPAKKAQIFSPDGLAFDALGQLYIAESGGMRIRKVDLGGVITTIAGNGTRGYSGDGGPAVAATLDVPQRLAVDPLGQVYVGDFTARVRKVDLLGRISTVVGTGVPGHSGDGGPATAAKIEQEASALWLDGSGALFVGTRTRVRKVSPVGIITTVGGTGAVSGGDGEPATAAGMLTVSGVWGSDAGDLYISEWEPGRIRRVDPAGIITTFAGFTGKGSPGDGGPAEDAQLRSASALTVGADGSVYVGDFGSVRRIDPSGIITTLAGDRRKAGGATGDGGPAVDAALTGVAGLAVDLDGTVYLTDAWGVRKVDPTGTITRLAGQIYRSGLAGDGGPATDALLNGPAGLALDRSGNLYVADMFNNRVRRIDPSGRITTAAGTGVEGVRDGSAVTTAQLGQPAWIAAGRSGDVWIGEPNARRVRKLSAGAITTVAILPGGPGEFTGPIALDGDDTVYTTIGSASAPRVVRLTPSGPVAVAGNGTRGSWGDGGPATAAPLGPTRLAFGRTGNLYLADHISRRVRMVEAAGAPDALTRAAGYNASGQLGNGVTLNGAGPTDAVALDDVASLGAGAFHSLAARNDGTAWGWGWNGLGQVGDGTGIDRSIPTRVPGLDRVSSVAAGAYHSVALRDDGTVWTWGWNHFGQLGDGMVTDRRAPVRVPDLGDVVAVSAGAHHTVALLADGTVRAWGFNRLGQLGDGTQVDRHNPVSVPSLSDVRKIAGGGYHTLSVQNDGTVRAWGWNGLGQLGNGSTGDSAVPAEVPGLDSVGDLAQGGYFHAAAIKTDGTVWTWGWNGYGQLGTGSTQTSTTPQEVPGLKDVASVAAGAVHTLGTGQAGTTWSWGGNPLGQLGDGTTRDSRSPRRSLLATSSIVAGGAMHSLASGSPS